MCGWSCFFNGNGISRSRINSINRRFVVSGSNNNGGAIGFFIEKPFNQFRAIIVFG